MKPIRHVDIEQVNSIHTQSDGDLWPCAWAEDDAIYTANGDGKGFDLQSEWCDIVVSRVRGGISDLIGERLTGPEGVGPVFADPLRYNRKPTGMVSACGRLYMVVQNLNMQSDSGGFDDVPCATVCVSEDWGKTWTYDREKPMFDAYVFTTIFFLDYGKANENSPDGYVYAYGMDNNWRASFCGCVPSPTALSLARIPAERVADLSAWRFFCGMSADGQPQFTQSIAARVPVLQDTRTVTITPPAIKGSGPQTMSVISQGSVVYNKSLARYLYTSWTENSFEFYEAPAPWGPFRLFLSHDFGFYPWTEQRYGGYGTVIPSKFISDDGKTMYVVSCTFVGGVHQYGFHLRRMTVDI